MDEQLDERAVGHARAVAAGFVGNRLVGTEWHHMKSGGVYTIVACAAREDLSANVVVYREASGATWTRPQDKFFDGRFEYIAPNADDADADATSLPEAQP